MSGLPPHYLGVHGDQPASADALRASEASLTARAEARQATFGRSWEQVARLMTAVRHGVDPDRVEVRVTWADAATRSVAQEADAVVKLYGAGLLPASYALQRLGYTADEVTEIRTARRTEALDGAGVQLDGLLP
ncbi:MAG: phage portal protein [Nocardioidaceae bacterium]